MSQNQPTTISEICHSCVIVYMLSLLVKILWVWTFQQILSKKGEFFVQTRKSWLMISQRHLISEARLVLVKHCLAAVADMIFFSMDELVTTAHIVPSLWQRLVTSLFAMVVLHCVRHCIALIALIAQNLSSWDTQPSQANYFLYTMLHTMRCHEQWFNHSILLHIVCIPIERVHDTCIIDIFLAKTRAATKSWL